MTGTPGVTAGPVALDRVAVGGDTGLTVAVPRGWSTEVGPPFVATPATWSGPPPAIVVASHPGESLSGADLATRVARLAVTTLADPVVVDLVRHGDDVEIVVAHRHRGVDVTTVERHRCRPGEPRWTVGFTAADTDLPALAPVMHHVVASLSPGPAGAAAGR